MSNDSYTLKEMVQELRLTARDQVQHTAEIRITLENIDKHLAQLNSKVASHEKRFNGLESFQTRVMTVWGIATFVVVTVLNRFL